MSIPDSELDDPAPKQAPVEETKQEPASAAAATADSNQNKKNEGSAAASGAITLPASMQKLLNKSTFSASSTKPAAAATTVGVKAYTFATGRGNFPNHVITALKARGNWT